jgi:hypothetical protein
MRDRRSATSADHFPNGVEGSVTEEELQKLYARLRRIHRTERRRAWWLNKVEMLALSAVFGAVAWFMWQDDDTIESVFFASFGLILAIAAFT